MGSRHPRGCGGPSQEQLSTTKHVENTGLAELFGQQLLIYTRKTRCTPRNHLKYRVSAHRNDPEAAGNQQGAPGRRHFETF